VKIKAIILFIVIAIVTAGAVYGIVQLDSYLFHENVLRQFEDKALTVTELEISDTRIKVKLASTGDDLCPEDLQLVRYVNDAIPTIETEKTVYVFVCTPSGKVIYQKHFTDDNENITAPQSIPARYMDSTLLRAEIAYSFNQRGINCTAFKETEGSQCYIRGEEPDTQTGRILNFTISLPDETEAEKDDPELLAVYFEALISMLNQKGAGISQYNLYIKTANDVCVYLASIDLLSKDIVRLV
jgi:hypothetical protein